MPCNAAVDLSYIAPESTAIPADEPPQPKSLFPVQALPPLQLEYRCDGPQCQYETDLDTLHEDQTTRHWSIGIQ